MFSILSWYKFNCIQTRIIELLIDDMCVQGSIPEAVQYMIIDYIICPYCEILYDNEGCFCKILKCDTIKSVEFVIPDSDNED